VPVPRYRLTLEYDGTGFSGWQRQDNAPTVQAALEAAVARLCGETVVATAAGRTDAGVHALGQVVHLDLTQEWAPDRVRDALNFHLRPDPIAVVDAARAADDFHARFSATGRRYRYTIANRRAPLALMRGRAWWVPVPLDAAAMHQAAQLLIGRHDFTSFRAAECQAKSPVKTLRRLAIARDRDLVTLEADARSFLHHQVRNMVGTLKLVGEGKWSPADVAAALAARDRAKGGPTAPAEGLCLLGVDYAERDAEQPVDRGGDQLG
jgi:tRNA pseudouridine38-40 synthase